MKTMPARNRTFAAAIVGVLVLAVALAQGVAARGNTGSAAAQSTTAHTLSMQGHGEASVAPDMATITLGVQNHDSTAAAALASNSSRMNDVIAAVKAQNVPDSHIQTSDLSIYFDSQHDYYVVSHQITVKLDDTGRVGAVLDGAVSAGANNSWGVSFGLKDQSTERAQALKAAVADARKRADAMASALGVTVSGVGSASETSYSPQPIAYAARAAASAPSATNVQPGQLTVTADINVVYTFG